MPVTMSGSPTATAYPQVGYGSQTKLEREKEEARQAKVKEVSLEQRKKNDEYDKWLSTDHIRTIAEQAHERKDPSKMHEGAKFSGIPTDFTPGI